jgi:hypothetical protein
MCLLFFFFCIDNCKNNSKNRSSNSSQGNANWVGDAMIFSEPIWLSMLDELINHSCNGEDSSETTKIPPNSLATPFLQEEFDGLRWRCSKMKEWVFCMKWSGNQSGEHRSAGPNSTSGGEVGNSTVHWTSKRCKAFGLVEQDWRVLVYGPPWKCMPVQTTQHMYVEQLVLIFVCCFCLCSFLVGFCDTVATSQLPPLQDNTSHRHGQPITGSRFLTSCKSSLFLIHLYIFQF